MEPTTYITIRGKGHDFIEVLEERRETLERVLRNNHDGRTIIEGTCEWIILTHLLNRNIISYDEAKKHLKKEIGYGNPFSADEGGMGVAWHKPVLDNFDKFWEKYSKYVDLSIGRLRSELRW